MSMSKEEIIAEASRAAGIAADILTQALRALSLALNDDLAKAESELVASRNQYASARAEWDAATPPATPPAEPTQPA
jgi:hypothetical protein